MEKLKLIVILVITVYAANWSFHSANDEAKHYRDMATPEEVEEEVDHGPPVSGKAVQLTVDVYVFDPPVGEPADEEYWEFDITTLILDARIVTMSESKTGYYFVPERCLKCHEKDGPGQWFYGNDDYTKVQDLSTAEGLRLVSIPEKGIVPTLEYIYKDTHLKKVPFDIGMAHKDYMKRGY